MKKMISRLLFTAALLLGYFPATKAATPPPCTPVKPPSQEQNIILAGPQSPDTVQVYFFKNIYNQGIWIDHPVKHPSASAGWSSYFQAGNASALTVDRKDFAISCAVINPGKMERLNCAKVLTVCSYPAHPKQKGSGWIAEDLKWDALLKRVAKRGY